MRSNLEPFSYFQLQITSYPLVQGSGKDQQSQTDDQGKADHLGIGGHGLKGTWHACPEYEFHTQDQENAWTPVGYRHQVAEQHPLSQAWFTWNYIGKGNGFTMARTGRVDHPV